MEEGIPMSAAYAEAMNFRQKVRDFEQQFHAIYNLTISFADDALGEIIKQSFQDDLDPWEICEATVKDYEYGLKLINERTGKDHFTLHRSALIDPEEYLNQLIRESYDHHEFENPPEDDNN